ncbi:DNA-directed RNA polymerase subunit alpha C-terminal domain-containing protein [Bengtsoniella intestinalis]|uniref:DNA-directed RNA polymerase subunit alpha C-terminal domain-containing protein n=1 Tax=Bengtsoniella intestinalis TaxID=3073143 RepID=UPI00391F697D
MKYYVYDDSVERLELSVRAKNTLRRAGIHTVGALMDFPAEDLIKIRNSGQKTVNELMQMKEVIILVDASAEGYVEEQEEECVSPPSFRGVDGNKYIGNL